MATDMNLYGTKNDGGGGALHFVTGGAFNGKSKWVREYYQLNEKPHEWISAYQRKAAPKKSERPGSGSVIVLEGIEM